MTKDAMIYPVRGTTMVGYLPHWLFRDAIPTTLLAVTEGDAEEGSLIVMLRIGVSVIWEYEKKKKGRTTGRRVKIITVLLPGSQNKRHNLEHRTFHGPRRVITGMRSRRNRVVPPNELGDHACLRLRQVQKFHDGEGISKRRGVLKVKVMLAQHPAAPGKYLEFSSLSHRVTNDVDDLRIRYDQERGSYRAMMCLDDTGFEELETLVMVDDECRGSWDRKERPQIWDVMALPAMAKMLSKKQNAAATKCPS
ncbi:hypothetical protein F5148DRAFT_1151809 [Russula earlei]|uniref:Uncharacterized protein n=1 Tax=Russula earlei TaxID=71964 RepID=A0ACC0TYV0_9AGAM|nr:hypothetical protein F5148DRAFT_1151809 [Russula earlei]